MDKDEGNQPGKARHIGGVRKGVLMDPWAVAVDGKGRVFTYDYGRGRIVRTNDDGSDWLQSEPIPRLIALHIDRKRGRLFRSSAQRLDCSDLDLNDLQDVQFPQGWRNLGAVDAEGNLYVSRSGETSRSSQTAGELTPSSSMCVRNSWV